MCGTLRRSEEDMLAFPLPAELCDRGRYETVGRIKETGKTDTAPELVSRSREEDFS